MQLIFGPSPWGELGDLPVGGVGKFFQDFFEVAVGVDVVASAGFHDGVEDGTAVSGICIAKKEPVLFPDGGGADRIFHQVVVDLNTSIIQINTEEFPVGECVVDGLSHGAFGKVAAFPFYQCTVDALVNDSAVAGSDDSTQSGLGLLPPQLCFDVVEVGDLTQEPSGFDWCLLLGFKEASSSVCPAASQCYRTFLGKAGVGAVGIALDSATKVFRYDFVQTFCSPAGVPGEDGVTTGGVGGPEVAEFGGAVSRAEVTDGRFVDLHVVFCQYFTAHLLVNGTEPVCGKPHPACHRLAGKLDIMPDGKDGFLSVERKMITVFPDNDLCQ